MRPLTANLTEEGTMRRLIWLAVLLAGCGRDPYPRLAGGERAILFDSEHRFIGVEIDSFGGVGKAKEEILEVGTPVLVLSDNSEKSGEKRPIRARVTEGEHRGLGIKAERHYLKVE
jgi:hypothetical protein